MKHKMINSTLYRLFSYTLSYKKSIFLGLSLLMIAAAAEVTGPILFKYFIDTYLIKTQWQMTVFALFTGAFIFLQVIAASSSYFQAIIFNKVAQQIVTTLRLQTFRTALRLPASYLDQHQTGHIISTISNDTETLLQFYVQVIGQSLQKLVLLIGIQCGMYLLNPKLAICVTVMVCIAFSVMFLYQKKSLPWSKKARSSLSILNNQISETLHGIPIIQSFVKEAYFSSRFSLQNDAYIQSKIKILKLNGLLLRPLIDLLYITTLCAILTQFAFDGASIIQVGVVYAFVSYMGRMIEPLNELTNQLTQIQQAIIAGERIFKLHDEPIEFMGIVKNPLKGHIRFQNVYFRYLENTSWVSQNISFEIPQGHMFALVGHTGSGKSTLLHLLTGMYSLDKGDISIDGTSISEWNKLSLRSQIGVIQQDPFIFTGTVAENVRFGRNEITNEQIITALSDVCWFESVNSENSLQMDLQENGKNLSSGQKQLLSFARALVTRPPIMILDEATASIDTQTERLLQKALQTIRTQHTWLVVAHRLSTIVNADQILVLQHGKIIERGTHEELLNLQQHYAMLYQLQQTQVS